MSSNRPNVSAEWKDCGITVCNYITFYSRKCKKTKQKKTRNETDSPRKKRIFVSYTQIKSNSLLLSLLLSPNALETDKQCDSMLMKTRSLTYIPASERNLKRIGGITNH